MKIVDFSSPLGILAVGTIILAIGYSMHILGVLTNDPSYMDSGIPIEKLGVALIATSGFMYGFIWIFRQFFR